MFVAIALGCMIGYAYSINITSPLPPTPTSFPPKDNCNSWASWVNENHPSPSNKGDKEYVPNRTMLKFCPTGKVNKLQCKDNKGEPFQGNFTSSGRSYFISCSDISVGVICTPLNSTIISFCPDMSLRYYCSCAPLNANSPKTSALRNNTTFLTTATKLITSAETTRPPNTNVTTTRLISLSTSYTRKPRESSSTTELFRLRTMSTIKGSSSNVILTSNRTSGEYNNRNDKTEAMMNVGKISVKWWIFLLVVAGITFVLNIGISVCLYYRLKSKVNMKQSKKAVHPLNLS